MFNPGAYTTFDSISAGGASPNVWGELNIGLVTGERIRTIPTPVGRTRYAPHRSPCRTDHPHTRGENAFVLMNWPPVAGPSPLAWGEPVKSALPYDKARTIPTHVGRTDSKALPPTSRTDHPHTRGENFGLGIPAWMKTGPSPHTWGEPARRGPCADRVRTIPTRVGRTQA